MDQGVTTPTSPLLHPIRVVARRTGLKADLIRAWERRYGAVRPGRDGDNRRVYSDDDVTRLSLLKTLVDLGRPIGTIANLPTKALHDLAGPDLADTDEISDFVDRLVDGARRLDSGAIHRVAAEAEVALGTARFMTELLPEIIEWTRSAPASGAAVVTGVLGARLQADLVGAWERDDPRPTAAVVSRNGDATALEALATASAAARSGWQVTMLRGDLEGDELHQSIETLDPRLIILCEESVAALQQDLAQGGRSRRTVIVSSTAGDPAARPEHVAMTKLESWLHRALRRATQPGAHDHPHARPPADEAGALPPLRVPTTTMARQAFGIETGGDPCLVVTGLDETRRLVHLINVRQPADRGVSAGGLQAAALLHDFGHRLIARCSRALERPLMDDALDWLEERSGVDVVAATLAPIAGELGLDNQTGTSEAVGPYLLEEVLLLRLANRNPALAPIRDLFDDRPIEAAHGYRPLIDSLDAFFATCPGLGPDHAPVIHTLARPFVEFPTSLEGQLNLLIRLEGELAGPVVDRLLLALDVLREENRSPFDGDAAPPSTPPRPVLRPMLMTRPGPAHYSRDADWMGGLVLGARHTLVWLDQLERRFGRPVRQLDQVPDEAIEDLAADGINGLWLVGLWQRSAASARIKRAMGMEDAAASAYALDAYRIADDLGGDLAFADLQARAARFGIRLGCDIVANHTGIDSPWVIDHPERFLAVDASPFPGYSFTGDDLSPDPRVSIHLADQYFDRSDAAVVFRRTATATGATRYLYHGNDGTGLPWNDTAQLDLLEPATRRALVDEIVAVARRVPILRLDAAMVLARRHVQRLWYPPPGQGGAIPSRSGHGLSAREFDQRMPREFWLEVMDRVREEAPGTLMLAEAFWMMEAFFVRDLGMHRVYNSAFMHHLRDEENGRFRAAIQWALDNDPQVLARQVNFLTTPDERTAADQFGAGAKYRGACLLMAVLPGTPLLGHGQTGGLSERYGMEFRRAHLDEQPDADVARFHREVLAPLFRRRREFTAVDSFRLLVARDSDGRPNDDILAVANRVAGHPMIAVFNNRATHARAVLGATTHRPVGASGAETLAQWLGNDGRAGVGFRDHVTGRVIRVGADTLRQTGLELEIGPYEAQILESVQGKR
jgi:glycosidase